MCRIISIKKLPTLCIKTKCLRCKAKRIKCCEKKESSPKTISLYHNKKNSFHIQNILKKLSYKESGVPKFTVTIDNTYTKQTNTDHFKVQIKPHHIKIKPVKTLKYTDMIQNNMYAYT